MECDRDTTSIF